MIDNGSMFIAIEGIDGSGKTTLAGDIASYTGFYLTREPTDRFCYDYIEADYNDESSIINFFLFTLDRYMHQKEIKNHLINGVISDRYVFSSIAYQGSGMEKRFKNMDETISWMLDVSRFIIMPDLIIYLKIDPGLALKRLNLRKNEKKNTDAFERLEMLKNVSKYYDYIFSGIIKIPVIKINAEMEYNYVKDEAIKGLNDYL
ncbi:dTMP kinase [Picrophilus oshimae]|uniref:Probable thymidylate kinase n=1 Tax=Picrophilus torridus (strain ATCC 700027 / DSM 9790 / JCM 10055 / NBRC 100828 / KAW 2/3) TaxID=1122961 RepID=A0A8G2FXI6_PICTO|nr:dTMP kinase [Picrophilus oshimae]SMD31310.1 thymidylate kinase [Picrophilus oshimae DSM 9789]